MSSSSSLSGGSRGAGVGQEYQSAATRRALRLFEKFNEALNNSLPSSLARESGHLSVVNPSLYLRQAAIKNTQDQSESTATTGTSSSAPSTSTTTSSSSRYSFSSHEFASHSSSGGSRVGSHGDNDLPKVVRDVCACQIKTGLEKGQWRATPQVLAALSGGAPNTLPSAPEGIPDWRWSTALAVATLRRYPEHYDRIRSVYDAGAQWVMDEETLRLAREALPPVGGSWKQLLQAGGVLGSAEDLLACQKGKWRDVEARTMKESGYIAFVKEEGREGSHDYRSGTVGIGNSAKLVEEEEEEEEEEEILVHTNDGASLKMNGESEEQLFAQAQGNIEPRNYTATTALSAASTPYSIAPTSSSSSSFLTTSSTSSALPASITVESTDDLVGLRRVLRLHSRPATTTHDSNISRYASQPRVKTAGGHGGQRRRKKALLRSSRSLAKERQEHLWVQQALHKEFQLAKRKKQRDLDVGERVTVFWNAYIWKSRGQKNRSLPKDRGKETSSQGEDKRHARSDTALSKQWIPGKVLQVEEARRRCNVLVFPPDGSKAIHLKQVLRRHVRKHTPNHRQIPFSSSSQHANHHDHLRHSSASEKPIGLYQPHAGLQELAAKWQQPVRSKQERKRLQKLYDPKKKPTWDSSSSASRDKNTPLRRDATKLYHEDEINPVKEAAKRVLRRRTVYEAKRRKSMVEQSAASYHGQNGNGSGLSFPAHQQDHQRKRSTLDGSAIEVIKAAEKARKRAQSREKLIQDGLTAEQRVIRCIMAHEAALREIEVEARRSEKVYTTAATKSEAIHAFEELTAMIRASLIRTCEVVESVEMWRRAMDRLDQLGKNERTGVVETGGGMMLKSVVSHVTKLDTTMSSQSSSSSSSLSTTSLNETKNSTPHRVFYWGGRNILREIPHSMNFLGNFDSLKRYYGAELSLYDNPFIMAVPLRERPPTPIPAFQTVIIDNRPVKVPSKSMADAFEAAERKLQEAQTRQANSASWWPCANLNEGESKRVRRASKVLLEEERIHQQKGERKKRHHG